MGTSTELESAPLELLQRVGDDLALEGGALGAGDAAGRDADVARDALREAGVLPPQRVLDGAQHVRCVQT